MFNSLYNGPVKLLSDVIHKTKDQQGRSNLYHMARIWRAYVFQRLVDTYGDVPYFKSGKAFLEGDNLPEYDDHQLIYEDILKEYEDATDRLDANQPTESGDLFFKGNITQWKKLGNSLLLRSGMRYTRCDPVKAKLIVLKALDPARGGVMESNGDNAFIAFNSTFTNPTGSWLQGTERHNVYLGKPFVDFLKATRDPRLPVISVKYEDPTKPIGEGTGKEDSEPAKQEGMPYGYNESTIHTAPGFPGKTGAAFKYSQINRRTVGKIEAPEFFITYAQTQLLMAEAAYRNWIQGDAATYYKTGIKAHMDQLKQYDATTAIPASSQDAYLASHSFNPIKALEQINTQYWIASFLNGPEAFANFRRSGFPVLTPNPYGQPNNPDVPNGTFIRRLTYPTSELSVNTDNVNEAIARQGADKLSTRVWWDKP
jgi:hypothetical protein